MNTWIAHSSNLFSRNLQKLTKTNTITEINRILQKFTKTKSNRIVQNFRKINRIITGSNKILEKFTKTKNNEILLNFTKINKNMRVWVNRKKDHLEGEWSKYLGGVLNTCTNLLRLPTSLYVHIVLKMAEIEGFEIL